MRAPIGAPLALLLSGLLGFTAERVRDAAPARRRGSWGSRPAGRWRRSPRSECSERSAKPGCCISAAPTITRRCSLPVTLPPVAAGLLGERGAGAAQQGSVVHALVAAPDRCAWAWLASGSTPMASRATWAAGATGAECAERPAAARAAQLHRPRAGRPCRTRTAGGSSRCVIAIPATMFSQAQHAVLERTDPAGHRPASRHAARAAFSPKTNG